MENQHQKIKGYRGLSQQEIDLMNAIKDAGEVLLNLQALVVARLNTDGEIKRREAGASKLSAADEGSDQSTELRRFEKAEPHRWASIAKTDIQTGVMALVRSIAQPTNC